jgi:hypothetical protein
MPPDPALPPDPAYKAVHAMLCPPGFGPVHGTGLFAVLLSWTARTSGFVSRVKLALDSFRPPPPIGHGCVGPCGLCGNWDHDSSARSIPGSTGREHRHIHALVRIECLV